MGALIPPPVLSYGVTLAVKMIREDNREQAGHLLTRLYVMDPLDGFAVAFALAEAIGQTMYPPELPEGATAWAKPASDDATEADELGAALVAAIRNDDLKGAGQLWESLDTDTRVDVIAKLALTLALTTPWGR